MAPKASTARSRPQSEAQILTFPNSPYRLHQTFAPAGDQPQAIEKLTEGVRRVLEGADVVA